MSECEHDFQDLANTVMPFAITQLKKHQNFHPFGALITIEGDIRLDGFLMPNQTSDPDTAVNYFKEICRDGAERKKFRATVIVYDANITLPFDSKQTDVIVLLLDHADLTSSKVYFPYRRHWGDIKVGESFSLEGDHEIFKSHPL